MEEKKRGSSGIRMFEKVTVKTPLNKKQPPFSAEKKRRGEKKGQGVKISSRPPSRYVNSKKRRKIGSETAAIRWPYRSLRP